MEMYKKLIYTLRSWIIQNFEFAFEENNIDYRVGWTLQTTINKIQLILGEGEPPLYRVNNMYII